VAQAISLGVTAIPSGTRTFVINGLPLAKSGFVLTVGTDSSWLNVGHLFNLTLEVSLNGTTFSEWATFDVDTPMFDKQDAPLSQWMVQGVWPGEADAQGIRQKLKITAVRVTLVIPAPFSIANLSMLALA